MRNRLNILAMAAAAYLGAFMPAIANDDSDNSAKEDQVKVAFLYNFVKFVEWPATQSLNQTHAANVCILGENPFGGALSILQRASSPQLAINVKLNVSEGDLPRCHILFINLAQEERMAAALASIRSYPVLTVSQIAGFVDNGGIVEMVKTEKDIGLFSKNKINLRINARLAEAKGAAHRRAITGDCHGSY